MSNEHTLREQREYLAILSPLGKAISGDEIGRTRKRLIGRLQWCSSDERENHRQLAKRAWIALTSLPDRFLEFSDKGFRARRDRCWLGSATISCRDSA